MPTEPVPSAPPIGSDQERRARFTLTWDDPNDAREVADVLHRAALDKRGRIRDHGFEEDSRRLLRQVEKYERDEGSPS